MKIQNKYSNFILESNNQVFKGEKRVKQPEQNLILSDKFKSILKSIMNIKQSNISSRLLELDRNKDHFFCFSYIDVNKDGETLSYLQSNRIERLKSEGADESDFWTSKLRVSQKIGRFMKQILPSFSDESIENFVKKFKIILKEEEESVNFEMVEGDMIIYWYDYRNYENDKGSLGKSVMSGPESAEFLSLYSGNPDRCKMLILKNQKGDKIKGRSLVWRLSVPKNYIFMDRVYVNNYDDEIMFTNYARRQGWMFKTKQEYGKTDFNMPGGKTKSGEIVVDLDYTKFKYYPYVDTLRYYYPDLHKLSSSSSKYESPYITLTDIYGYYEEYKKESEEYDPMVYDKYNDIEIPESDAVWCRYDKGYIKARDAIKINNNEYAYPNSQNVVYSEYTKKWYPREECEYSGLLNSWIWNKYAVIVYHDKDRKTQPDITHRFELNKSIGMIGKYYYDIDLLYVKNSKKVWDTQESKYKTVIDYGFKKEETPLIIEDDEEITEGEQ